MFLHLWLLIAVATYITDPCHMFHYDGSSVWERWGLAFLCLFFWFFIWLLWVFEWLVGTLSE